VLNYGHLKIGGLLGQGNEAFGWPINFIGRFDGFVALVLFVNYFF